MAQPFETFRGIVLPAQCDAMGHLNTKEYVGFFDVASWHCLLRIGFTVDWVHERRIGFADARHVIDYRSELLAGDLVVGDSAVLRVGSKSYTARHRLFNASTGVLCAEQEVVSVQYDLTTRKSLPLLDVVREGARALIAGDA